MTQKKLAQRLFSAEKYVLLASMACVSAGSSTAFAAATPLGCEGLVGLTLPAASIGLPTSGAKVLSAKQVVGSGEGPAATGAYCQALAEIASVDSTAPPIRVGINLPVAWNKKILMVGGGSYNGIIPNAVSHNLFDLPGGSTPLGRGYATFSSDGGHQGQPVGREGLDGSFGRNAEALRNFAGDSIKKTHDVALAVVKAHYGVQAPEKAYFWGRSRGGQEALIAAQRFPQDWDGVISQYPAIKMGSLILQFGRISRAFAEPGAYLNIPQRTALYRAAMQACDALDGVEDGLVSNNVACQAVFDPAKAMLEGKPLQCPGGGAGGDSCLSGVQIAALQTYNTAITFDPPLPNGVKSYPGFNLWGSDTGVERDHPYQKRLRFTYWGDSQPAHPMPENTLFGAMFWDQFARWLVAGDPQFNALMLDPQQPGQYQARMREVAALIDAWSPDLGAFKARGGKLLLTSGPLDVTTSARATEAYVASLNQAMGESAVRSFLRFYEVAGIGHGYSTVFSPRWDWLATLENWVEKGTSPPPQSLVDTVVAGRTRPMCEYPSYPHYDGKGDVNRSESFVCTRPKTLEQQ